MHTCGGRERDSLRITFLVDPALPREEARPGFGCDVVCHAIKMPLMFIKRV